ncbi:hypothetical protein B0H10DRAFT_710037 [Mycena sp. CBHHK59/15]|nr:hypothetical protein B0H10DRAFT_710037 [Mycena sp. CBHHK59/15]
MQHVHPIPVVHRRHRRVLRGGGAHARNMSGLIVAASKRTRARRVGCTFIHTTFSFPFLPGGGGRWQGERERGVGSERVRARGSGIRGTTRTYQAEKPTRRSMTRTAGQGRILKHIPSRAARVLVSGAHAAGERRCCERGVVAHCWGEEGVMKRKEEGRGRGRRGRKKERGGKTEKDERRAGRGWGRAASKAKMGTGCRGAKEDAGGDGREEANDTSAERSAEEGAG